MAYPSRIPPSRPGPGRPGFTLVELLIALAIGGILLLLGGATVGSWIPRYQQHNEATALVQSLLLARSEAIKRGNRVDLCPSADQATCDPAGRWELGWMIFDDPDRDGDRDPGEGVIRVDGRAGNGVTVRGNRPVATYVSYTSQGYARTSAGALQMGTFTVCKPGLTAIEVVLANGGRPRLQDVATPCP